mmetsp:Transcript_37150/g.100541  ORF Transcript_37150/g.100541 Transcript_37150/m.100541 type:complete len:168 (-) Transcript_37150:210-713(-)
MVSTRLVALFVPYAFSSALKMHFDEREKTAVRTAHRWLGYNETEGMQEAIYAGRDNVWPQLLEDDPTDYEWYKDYYSSDANNPLEELSFTANATQPSASRVAAEERKERKAYAAVRPRLAAEEAEADYYYHAVFPFDDTNELEEWSYLNHTHPRATNATNATNTSAA